MRSTSPRSWTRDRRSSGFKARGFNVDRILSTAAFPEKRSTERIFVPSDASFHTDPSDSSFLGVNFAPGLRAAAVQVLTILRFTCAKENEINRSMLCSCRACEMVLHKSNQQTDSPQWGVGGGSASVNSTFAALGPANVPWKFLQGTFAGAKFTRCS